MSLENFLRVSDALHVPLSYLLHEEKADIPEAEQIMEILEGRDSNQRGYLLHMLREMAKGMDEL